MPIMRTTCALCNINLLTHTRVYTLHWNRKRKCDFGFSFCFVFLFFCMAYCDSKSPKYNKLYISFNSISFTKRNQIQANKGPPLWVLARWRPAGIEEEETRRERDGEGESETEDKEHYEQELEENTYNK